MMIRSLKTLVGSMLASGTVASTITAVMPQYRKRLLSAWPYNTNNALPQPHGVIARGVFHKALAHYYAPTTSTAQREKLKRICMAPPWAGRDKEFPNVAGRDTQVMFDHLEGLLASGNIQRVHEVACGTGREIGYFATKYPAIEFVGSDLSQPVADLANERWEGLSNLRFTVIELDQLTPLEQDLLKTDLIFSCGGIQYLDESSLCRYFDVTRRHCHHLLFTELVSRDFLMDEHQQSTPGGFPGGEFAWNHPYKHYLTQAGWNQVECEIGLIDQWPKEQTVNGIAH